MYIGPRAADSYHYVFFSMFEWVINKYDLPVPVAYVGPSMYYPYQKTWNRQCKAMIRQKFSRSLTSPIPKNWLISPRLSEQGLLKPNACEYIHSWRSLITLLEQVWNIGTYKKITVIRIVLLFSKAQRIQH